MAFVKPPKGNQEEMESFIADAEARGKADVGAVASERVEFPLAGGARAGVLSLRLTPREAAILRWLGETGKKSQHQIVLEGALAAMEAEARKLLGNPEFKI